MFLKKETNIKIEISSFSRITESNGNTGPIIQHDKKQAKKQKKSLWIGIFFNI